MDVEEYRKRYEAEIAQAGNLDKTEPQALAADTGADPEARAAAIESTSIDPKNLGGFVEQLLRTLRDRDEPEIGRLAALHALNAAAFLGPRFAPYRAEYMDTLR